MSCRWGCVAGCGFSTGDSRSRLSGLVEVVVVVVVFVVVVVLMPLHHLRQAALVEHHAGQVPHLLALHHGARGSQGPQRTVLLLLLLKLLVLMLLLGRRLLRLAIFGPLLVPAVGTRGLVWRGLAGQRHCWRWGSSAPHHPTGGGLGGRRPAVSLGRAQSVLAGYVLAPWRPRADGVDVHSALRGCRCRLRASVVRVGVAVLWLVGARPRLVCGS